MAEIPTIEGIRGLAGAIARDQSCWVSGPGARRNANHVLLLATALEDVWCCEQCPRKHQSPACESKCDTLQAEWVTARLVDARDHIEREENAQRAAAELAKEPKGGE